MNILVIIMALLILLCAYNYFNNEKYIELSTVKKKEDFKNIMIYKYDNIN